MKKQVIITIIFLFSFWKPYQSAALEQLSETDMDSVSGQMGSIMVDPNSIANPENLLDTSSKLGGITVITSPILIRHTENSLRFQPSVGHLQFNNLFLSIEINSTWNWGYNAPIKFDTLRINEPDTVFTDYWDGGASSQTYYIENPLNGYTASTINASNAVITLNADMDEVVFNNKSLGMFEVEKIKISKIQTEILAVDDVINYSVHSAVNIDRIEYNHDTESTIDPRNSITINGLMVAQKFQVGGIDNILPSYSTTVSPGNEIDSSLWTSTGTFKIGTGDRTPLLSFQDDNNLIQGAPTASVNPYSYSSIQIRGDSTPYIRHKYTIRTGDVSDMSTIYENDPDGYIGDGSMYPYVANPRLNKSYIEAKVAFEGSIRARGIEGYVPQDTTTSTWGNANIGIVAADGVRSLTIIEAPGYGYGNNWHLPYDESKYQ
jgi:hypothetical protein